MNLTEKYTTFSKRSYMRAALCVKNSTKLANSVDSRYTAIPHHCPDKTNNVYSGKNRFPAGLPPGAMIPTM